MDKIGSNPYLSMENLKIQQTNLMANQLIGEKNNEVNQQQEQLHSRQDNSIDKLNTNKYVDKVEITNKNQLDNSDNIRKESTQLNNSIDNMKTELNSLTNDNSLLKSIKEDIEVIKSSKEDNNEIISMLENKINNNIEKLETISNEEKEDLIQNLDRFINDNKNSLSSTSSNLLDIMKEQYGMYNKNDYEGFKNNIEDFSKTNIFNVQGSLVGAQANLTQDMVSRLLN